jgi:hypothetical protein
MEVAPESVDFVGYGAIYMAHGMLGAGLKSMLAAMDSETPPDRRPYDESAAMAITALRGLRTTPVWGDAQKQMITVIERYQDLIDVFARGDWGNFQAVGGEFHEMLMIARASLAQLARRISLDWDK